MNIRVFEGRACKLTITNMRRSREGQGALNPTLHVLDNLKTIGFLRNTGQAP